MSLTLIDASSSSLTVSWPETAGAKRYILQYRKATCSDKEEEYTTLSENLTSTQARKRNLEDTNKTGFMFRAAAILRGEEDAPNKQWKTHQEPFHLLDAVDEKNRLDAPVVTLGGSHQALLVSWKKGKTTRGSGDVRYELQMRENQGGVEWKTIAPSLSSTEVKKKNLTSSNGYQFRVRPASASASSSTPFSPPSDAVVSLGLSRGLQSLFSGLDKGSLLKNVNDPVPLSNALGGKEFVLLYASAHWCGPCRQFTPMLSKWYKSLGANATTEVVFLSADHDEKGFQGYFRDMPWVAVDYEDDARERLMAHIKVSGIPRLAVLDGRTGRMIEENAVGKTLDVNRWRTLARK